RKETSCTAISQTSRPSTRPPVATSSTGGNAVLQLSGRVHTAQGRIFRHLGGIQRGRAAPLRGTRGIGDRPARHHHLWPVRYQRRSAGGCEGSQAQQLNHPSRDGIHPGSSPGAARLTIATLATTLVTTNHNRGDAMSNMTFATTIKSRTDCENF